MQNRFSVLMMIVFSVAWSALVWADENGASAEQAVELKVANRSIMVFRATLLGEAPTSRVKRAKAVISEALEEADDLAVSIDSIQDSYLILLGTKRAFIVSPPGSGNSSAWRARRAAGSRYSAGR